MGVPWSGYPCIYLIPLFGPTDHFPRRGGSPFYSSCPLRSCFIPSPAEGEVSFLFPIKQFSRKFFQKSIVFWEISLILLVGGGIFYDIGLAI